MSRFTVSGLALANVRDYGAIGNGSTDDRAAIQSAIDDAIAQGLGGIFLPQGTYNCSVVGAATNVLAVTSANNFTIKGQGRSSVIRFTGESHASTARALLVFDGTGAEITVETLVLDGNKDFLSLSSDLTRLLDISALNRRVTIKDIELRESSGRAARVGGIVVELISFISCRIRDCDNSGLAFDDVAQVRISDCDFVDNAISTGVDGADILMTPTGAASTNDYIIEGNCIDHAQNNFGIFKSGTQPVIRLNITGNSILGSIRLENQEETIIANNTLSMGPPLAGSAAAGQLIELEACGVITIEGNSSRLFNSTSFVDISGDSDDVTIRGNEWDGVFGGGDGFTVSEINSLVITDNVVKGGADGGGDIVQLNAAAGGIDRVEVHDNMFRGNYGVMIDATPTTGDIGRLSIQDNLFSDNCRFLAGAGSFTEKPIFSGNWGDALAGFVLADLVNLPEPAVIAGGGFSRGTGGGGVSNAVQFAGTGDPEGAITGSVGDIFHRLDGVVGDVLYVKESGTDTTTGWISVNVFGSGYETATSLGRSTTTATIYQTKLSFTTTAALLSGATYRISWTARIDNDDITEMTFARLQDTTGAATIGTEVAIEPDDSSDRYAIGGFAEFSGTGSTNSFEVQFRTSDASGTAGIEDVRIEIWRVS